MIIIQLCNDFSENIHQSLQGAFYMYTILRHVLHGVGRSGQILCVAVKNPLAHDPPALRVKGHHTTELARIFTAPQGQNMSGLSRLSCPMCITCSPLMVRCVNCCTSHCPWQRIGPQG